MSFQVAHILSNYKVILLDYIVAYYIQLWKHLTIYCLVQYNKINHFINVLSDVLQHTLKNYSLW